jgi:ketosteroid isomerase-like protein
LDDHWDDSLVKNIPWETSCLIRAFEATQCAVGEQQYDVAHHFIAQRDYVVVQARGENRTITGQPYENTYCWIFRFSNSKVVELIEYADTALIQSALLPPA